MKKLLFLSMIVTILFSCSDSHSKKTTYQVQDWMAILPTNTQTMDGGIGWVRMVIYSDSIQYKEDTAGNGDVTKKKSVVTDTFYLLRTPDYSCPFKDSTGKQVNDPNTHQPIYYLSWRNANVAPKNLVKPVIPVPQSYLPGMLAAIPKPDTSYHAPTMQVTLPRETTPSKPTPKK